MSERLKIILTAVLAVIVGLVIGYGVGHWRGVKDGKTIESATSNVTAAKESTTANKQREKNDDETRKLSDPALIDDMRRNGWLRD